MKKYFPTILLLLLMATFLVCLSACVVHVHIYVAEEIIEPTCLEKGHYSRTCYCGVRYEGEIPAKGHTLVVDEAVPATCTQMGLTEGSHCSDCKTVFTSQRTIQSLPHNFNQNGRCSVCQSPYYSQGLTYEKASDGSLKVSSFGSATDTHLIIPSVHCNANVKTIGARAFANCTNLISVFIPASVKIIKDDAFVGCTSLMTITVDENNENYKSIDGNLYNKRGEKLIRYAMGKSDTSFVIPSDVNVIGMYAFSDSVNLTDIVIGNNVTSIAEMAFAHCRGLTSIEIPSSVNSIGKSAFFDCGNLTQMTLPFVGENKEGTSVGANTFFGYIFGSESYEGAKRIEQDSYSSASARYFIPINLTSVTIVGGDILDGAFSNCVTLENITLGDDVERVGDYAFFGCSDLSQVTLGKGITVIGENVFDNCTNLSNIIVEQNNTSYRSIDGNLYSRKTRLTLLQYAIGKTETTFTLSDEVWGIDSFAFSGVVNLQSVTMGSGLEDIAPYAFENCTNLKSVTIGENTLFVGNNAFFGCFGLTSIVIPDNVIVIGDSAFYGCAGITNLTLGNSVETIGSSAFSGCVSLTNVTIPESTTTIGDNAFSYCVNLTSVTISSGVTRIGSYAFERCYNLTSIYYTSTAENWQNVSVYSFNSYLNQATIYYYSQTEPTESGNYWHYGENNQVEIWN